VIKRESNSAPNIYTHQTCCDMRQNGKQKDPSRLVKLFSVNLHNCFPKRNIRKRSSMSYTRSFQVLSAICNNSLERSLPERAPWHLQIVPRKFKRPNFLIKCLNYSLRDPFYSVNLFTSQVFPWQNCNDGQRDTSATEYRMCSGWGSSGSSSSSSGGVH
jgi:hypothetical protein